MVSQYWKHSHVCYELRSTGPVVLLEYNMSDVVSDIWLHTYLCNGLLSSGPVVLLEYNTSGVCPIFDCTTWIYVMGYSVLRLLYS